MSHSREESEQKSDPSTQTILRALPPALEGEKTVSSNSSPGGIADFAELRRLSDSSVICCHRAEQDAARPQSEPSVSKPNVLIVDDDEIQRMILSRLMRKIGSAVIAVGSLEEARSAFLEQTGRFDVVIVDYYLKCEGQDGDAVIEMIRKEERDRHWTPCYVIGRSSAVSTPEVDQRFMKVGAQEICEKDRSLNDLQKMVLAGYRKKASRPTEGGFLLGMSFSSGQQSS